MSAADRPDKTPAPLLSSKSTIFVKVPPEVRRQIDQALIDRDPHSYRGVFARFNLQSYRVSWPAFLNYARQVRFEAVVRDRAAAIAGDTADLSETAMKVACANLIQRLMDGPRKAAEQLLLSKIYRSTQLCYNAIDTHAAKKEAAAEAARSKVVENALDMCAKLAEDGCIEIHPPDESSPDARPSYVIRTAENAHRADREAEQIDLQPNSARFPAHSPEPCDLVIPACDPQPCGAGIPACIPPVSAAPAQSDPACPHAGPLPATPRHDPEPLPHQPWREPFRETAHQHKPSQSPAAPSEPACPHTGPPPPTPRNDPDPCVAGIPACDPAISSKPSIHESSPPQRRPAMKDKPTKLNLTARRRTKNFFSALAADHGRFARAVEKTQPGRAQTRAHQPAPLRQLADDEPIPFELLQEVVKEVWGIDLPVNFGFEQECPLYEPPDAAAG